MFFPQKKYFFFFKKTIDFPEKASRDFFHRDSWGPVCPDGTGKGRSDPFPGTFHPWKTRLWKMKNDSSEKECRPRPLPAAEKETIF